MKWFFLGLFQNPSESCEIASNASDSDIFFVPGFNGLQAPINDPNATAGFIGIQPESKPDEFLRAILESIAFGMKQLLEIMETESPQSQTSDTIMQVKFILDREKQGLKVCVQSRYSSHYD